MRFLPVLCTGKLTALPQTLCFYLRGPSWQKRGEEKGEKRKGELRGEERGNCPELQY